MSISYASPERLSNNKRREQSIVAIKSADLYSMAIVIAESLNGQHPWENNFAF